MRMELREFEFLLSLLNDLSQSQSYLDSKRILQIFFFKYFFKTKHIHKLIGIVQIKLHLN
jgi:hypothetical protein